MGRAPCCDKANVKKGPWSPEEDAKLKSYIEQNGTGGNWIALPQKIGLKRCGKSCRLRWLNYLRPNIKHGGFSEEEDNIICSLYISIGSRWSIIAAQLPGRTDNDIKNYWNTRLKKKLLGKHRKEKHTSRTKNKNVNNINTLSDTLVYQSARPVNLPPIPYSNEDPRSNDHDSIRKLLIKLGGKFSNDHEDQPKFLYPTNDESALYDNSIGNDNMVPNSTQIIPNLMNVPQFDMVSGSTNVVISTMLQEPLRDNLAAEEYENTHEKVQGMEFFYDDIGSNGISSSGESMDWGMMNSLALASNNSEGFLQGLGIEEFGIHDKMRYASVE